MKTYLSECHDAPIVVTEDGELDYCNVCHTFNPEIKKKMIPEKKLAYFIADILNQSPTKCLHLKEIYNRVEHNQEIPIPNVGYKHIPLGSAYNEIKNWRGLSEKQLKSKVATEAVWENSVRWARQRLKDWGWLEENGRRGIWCLSIKGQEAIANYHSMALKFP